MADLLEAFAQHLTDAGIARSPTVAGPAPPIWRYPRAGTPAPGEKTGVERDDGIVLAVFPGGGIAPAPGEGSWQRQSLDLWIRTTAAAAGPPIEAQILAEFAPAPHGFRQAWDMAGYHVIESRIWRPLQSLGADEQAFSWNLAVFFETYA